MRLCRSSTRSRSMSAVGVRADDRGERSLELSALTSKMRHDNARTRREAAQRASVFCIVSAGVLALLEMRATVRPVDEQTLERATQLTQKTNQFNLTLVRRSRKRSSN
jgi:predicted enzyme involved in methoxymalonyl-ACP biosynthesis